MGRSAEKPREGGTSRDFSQVDVRFRKMESSDLDEVLRIERASFSHPWSARFFLEELRVPCARSLVAIAGEKIIGYVIYWLLTDSVDVHNLAVHPEWRRRGIGRSLLMAVIEDARGGSLKRVTLEVRKSNEAAQKLYHSLGFATRGVRRGYYSDNGEDALIMVLDLEANQKSKPLV